jgi:hypothetical protein
LPISEGPQRTNGRTSNRHLTTVEQGKQQWDGFCMLLFHKQMNGAHAHTIIRIGQSFCHGLFFHSLPPQESEKADVFVTSMAERH